MSWITNIMLSLPIGEDVERRICEVNEFFGSGLNGSLKDDEQFPSLVPINSCWELKGKSFEANVFVGAYNYFPIDEFLVHLGKVAWDDPLSVQVFIMDEEDVSFRIFNLKK